MKTKRMNLFLIVLLLSLIALPIKAQTLGIVDENSLRDCINTDGNICQLSSSITVVDTIELNKNVTIDLNGFNINNSTAGKHTFDITKGNVS